MKKIITYAGKKIMIIKIMKMKGAIFKHSLKLQIT